MDETLLKNLAGIIEKTHAQVVLSTHWRKSPELLNKLFAALDRHNISEHVVGATPSMCMGVECRPQEV